MAVTKIMMIKIMKINLKKKEIRIKTKKVILESSVPVLRIAMLPTKTGKKNELPKESIARNSKKTTVPLN